MFVKKLIPKTSSEVSHSSKSRGLTAKSSSKIPSSSSNSLDLSSVDPRLTLQHGVPASASVLAFEPAQRLLAVGCRDGRIKIFGREGVEILLRSPTSAPCKYLEFVNNEGRLVHVTTRNDIEVWDLSTRELVSYKKWVVDITSFTVLQGSPYLYIGDETGQVNVLVFDNEQQLLEQMAYTIPAQMTLCGLLDSGDANAPSVVSILPQPDAVYSRVVLVYGNGLIVLWGLHDVQVLAIRGGTEDQHQRLSGENHRGDVEEEEEKEICSACWAGSNLAVGYTDGDIWIWSLSLNSKAKAEKIDMSNSPLLKLSLSSEDFRMPVVVMRWSASKADRENKEKGLNGFLYMFGGQQMGAPEVVTVFPLSSPASQFHLRLCGSFADVLLLPSVVGGASDAVMVLTTPGRIDVYEEVSIASFLSSPKEGFKPPPVPFKLAVTSSTVTAAKLVTAPEDNIVTSSILKLPRVLKSYIPAVLPAGTRWPVNGGSIHSGAAGTKPHPSLYVTGHENGFVNVWDASTSSLYFLASVECKGSEFSSISALDFCSETGTLAVGSDEGLVFVHSVGEAREGALYIVGSRELTKKDVRHPAGFQCFAVLKVHEAAIRTIVIASAASCLLIGDEAGKVSIFDLQTCALRFHGKCNGNTASVVGLGVLNIPQPQEASNSSVLRNKISSVVFVLTKDADLAAIDGHDGRVIASIRPRNPSAAIALFLLDRSGALIHAFTGPPKKKSTKQSVMMQVIHTDVSGDHIMPATAVEEQEENVEEENDWSASDNLVLLCSEDSLRLYSTSSILQGLRTTIRKEVLDKQCRSASISVRRSQASHLFLLYNTGELEIRSLPELESLKLITMSECLKWEFQTSPSFFNTFSVASNGQIAAVDGDREVLFLSIFKDENDSRSPDSYPSLYDKDVAAATHAAIRASVHVAAKKKQSQFQDLLGGVMKEIKQSLGASAGGGDHTADELPKLFSKQLFPVGNRNPKPSSPVSTSEKGTAASLPADSPREESPSVELDIDDIDLDDDEARTPSPSGGTSKKKGVIRKLRNSFKGVSKIGSSSKSPPSRSEDEERNILFEGGSSEAQSAPRAPAMRSADEIKAAYGHKKAGEASSAAAHARDRLMERQERLQNINRRTEEMQEGAENFASLAEELAKTMGGKKWYHI